MSTDTTATLAGGAPTNEAALLRLALADARISVALADLQLRYVWVANPPPLLQLSDLIERSDGELFGAAGLALAQLQAEALAQGGAARAELRLPLGPELRTFEVLARPAHDATGALIGVLTSWVALAAPHRAEDELHQAQREQEADELRQAEEALRGANQRLSDLNADLRRSRDLLRTIFDGLDDGLLLVGHDGNVLAVNQRFAALCNTPPEGLVGHDWRERCLALLPAFPVALVEASLADGDARQARVRSTDEQGRTRIFDLHTLGAAEGEGVPEQLVVQVREVTEQVRLEAQMVAAERMAANERLAATVAHEVNTPLQAIESSLHLAGKLADEEQRARYLRLAREEIRRIGYILRQLLDLHRPSLAPSQVAVNELIERVLVLTGGSLKQQRVYVVRALAQGLPPVTGYADELTQVLLNLIFNAMQAMEHGGRLTLRTALEQPPAGAASVVITVRDTGPGVDPAISARIFEPFYTTRAEGSGLGLAVCRQLVEGHGGRIWIESVPGEGASFYIALPLG